MTGLGETLGAAPTLPIAAAAAYGVLAITYDDGPTFDALLWSLTKDLKASGLRLAGVAQLNETRADRLRCDMLLEVLSTGRSVLISENRGSLARGCRLDLDVLSDVVRQVEGSLDDGAELLIVNKFGREEAEGRGLRNAIAIAVERRIPVLVGVPRRNWSAWMQFYGDSSVERPATRVAIDAWLADVMSHRSLVRRCANSR